MSLYHIAGQARPIPLEEGGEKCAKSLLKSLWMARSLLDNICTSLIRFLKKIVFSQDFLFRHRTGTKDFIRTRLLPFPTLILLFMNMLKGSIQDELDGFFQAIDQTDVPERKVTSGAFCRARRKLQPAAFVDLTRHLLRFFYEHFDVRRWRGMRLLAIDGSTLRLPRTPEVMEHFGTWNSALGDPCPLARTSQMFDVLNRISVDALVAPKGQGERELAAAHLDHVGPGDLLLLDRGYPSFWLFDLILSAGAHFCARVPVSGWNIVEAFHASGHRQQTLWLPASAQARKFYREAQSTTEPLRIRLIRIDLPQVAEPEILMTSLLDQTAFPVSLFKELYHLRWPVEEEYKVLKARMQIENFSGKSVLSIYQDFHAKVFTRNLTAALAHPAQQILERQDKQTMYAYRVNISQALSKMKNAAPLLFIRTRFTDLIENLHALFLKTVVPIRPDRKYPRKKHSIKIQGFYPAYKPIC
jgi:hypothetical protein